MDPGFFVVLCHICDFSEEPQKPPIRTRSGIPIFILIRIFYIYLINQTLMDTTIEPIINGSVNPRLTFEEFQTLPFDTKRRVVWGLMVSMEFPHCFPEVDRKCFVPYEKKWEHSSITPETADDLFKGVKEAYAKHNARMVNETSALHFRLGEQIWEAQKTLGFGGWLNLSKHRLAGYINSCGSWNDFKHNEVILACFAMDARAPRKDYGPNNPNTGQSMHKWKTVHGCEYIVMEFEFVDQKEVDRILHFFRTEWEPRGKGAKADSIRHEVVDHGHGYYGVELIWWWD